MGVILSTILLTLGSYIVQPDWFDNGPYVFESKHSSLEECQIATHGTSDICVGEQPSDRYKKSDVESKTTSTVLNFVECDYWAGCYIQE